MIKTIVFTHGHLADGAASAVKVIAGSIPELKTLSLTLEDNPDDKQAELNAFIDAGNEDDQFLILNDIFGGTPSNLSLMAAAFRPQKKIHVLAGVNLGMLLELASSIEQFDDVDALAKKVLDAGQTSVVDSSQKVRK
ncbi:MAG: PTS sugar transporter subunit IIA [Lactobacillus sp.]|jgi:mannose/fructose-specific phosphotransferase system component IIA|nr:PTS sugar transporter subunit IIA [Lactobacillus sp.]MCI2032335.1 PTS sugar transporter subunit IIA [Lactobacillus sp.]